MANVLKMAKIHAIQELLRAGHSQREIARMLNIHRETVGRYAKLLAKPAISSTGSGSVSESKPAISSTGSDSIPEPKPAISSAGLSTGRNSKCIPFHDIIIEKLDQDLDRIRIFQDLRDDHDFNGSYSSVKRYVEHLVEVSQAPSRRMESPPGYEAQVDFGSGPRICEDGHNRASHIFRITLSCSRKGYSEPVYHQNTESFIRALENAFRHFGGVPETLVIDNLKAAVKKADWYDPELNPKIEAFAKHYDTVILPCRPYTPEHKGKIESGVKYVKNNAIKGRKFKTLAELRQFLLHWETRIADTRIHGTTKKQVKALFESVERDAMKPLPSEPFPFFHESRRKVHRDAHIELDKSFYSVPPEYLGRSVWVRWNSVIVKIFNERLEQIAMHTKGRPGQFSTKRVHILDEKISGVERGADYLLGRIRRIGPESHQWAQAMLDARGIQGVRVLQGLLSLTRNHSAEQINAASKVASEIGVYRLGQLRKLADRVEVQPEGFAETHEIIRPLADYQLALFDSADKESL